MIATTWWTAHIANIALKHLNRKKFVYLIQEYEPFTFAHGTYYSLAEETYSILAEYESDSRLRSGVRSPGRTER